jgi:hypothetical protein
MNDSALFCMNSSSCAMAANRRSPRQVRPATDKAITNDTQILKLYEPLFPYYPPQLDPILYKNPYPWPLNTNHLFFKRAYGAPLMKGPHGSKFEPFNGPWTRPT